MGRKNSSARNKSRRLDRRPKGAARAPRVNPAVDRIKVEDIVLPDGQCLLNPRKPKARFATEASAAEALRQAKRQRRRTGSHHVEKRYYFCEARPCPDEDCQAGRPAEGHRCPRTGCDGYHLTSRAEYTPRAAS